MQADDLVWGIIGHNHCSYRVKTTTQHFCRNAYNASGLCNRTSCPLANSRYATVREHEGALFLYMKTIERAHSPKHMWEKVRLSHDYAKALEQIDRNLLYWPGWQIHKCKQRLTKITQYLIKLRKLRLRENGKMVVKRPKLEQREATREAKALMAAKLEKTLEKELVARLKSRAYGDAPLNVNEDVWKAVLDAERNVERELELEDEESDQEVDDEAELEFEAEEEDDDEAEDRELLSEFDESDDELQDLEDFDEDGFDDDDDDDDEPSTSKRNGKRPAPRSVLRPRPPKRAKRASTPPVQCLNVAAGVRLEIEYEHEAAAPQRLLAR